MLRPDESPHATAYVDRMIAFVAELVRRDAAYETSDGVYLSVEDVPGYGLLAHQPLDSLRAGARVEVDESKRSPLDFVLWKKAKPGEPTWESPFGDGPAGVAHRVRGHVARPARRRLRPARGRDRPDLPPPRERAGPGGGRRPDLRPPLGAQRLGHRGRREDVQVAGQLHLARRPAGPQRCPGLSAAGPAVPLPLAHRGHPGDDRPRPSRASPGWTSWRAASGSVGAAGRVGPVAARSSAPGRWRRTPASTRRRWPAFGERMDDDLDTPGALAGMFELVRGANVAADAGDVQRAAQAAATVGLAVRCARPPHRQPAPGSRSMRPPPSWCAGGTRPGRPATGHWPTRCAANWRPPAGWSRTAPTGTRVRPSMNGV